MSYLEPAFICLVLLGRGFSSNPLLMGGSGWRPPRLEPACPGWAAAAPLGWEWPSGGTAERIRASLWQGVLSLWRRAEPVPEPLV